MTMSPIDGSTLKDGSLTIVKTGGLQAALDAKQGLLAYAPVNPTRQILAGGLASGGGDLTSDKTITVPKALGADVITGVDDTKALTTKAVVDSCAENPLTDAATITPDFTAATNFTVTLAGNRILTNPAAVVVGKSGRIRVVQDATGARTLAYGTFYKWPVGVAAMLSTTGTREDYLYYDIVSSSKILLALNKDFR